MKKELPKVALNVCREVMPNHFQVFQIYAGMLIPLTKVHNSRPKAFNELYTRYYAPKRK